MFSHVNKGWTWVKVSSRWETLAADNYSEKTAKTKDPACLALDWFSVLEPSHFYPPGGPWEANSPTLELVLTLIRLDWFGGSDAGWPENSGRPTDRIGLAPGERTDGCVNLPPISYQSEQLLVGGRVWMVTRHPPPLTHTITSPPVTLPLFNWAAGLFCWGDNAHTSTERDAQGARTTNKDTDVEISGLVIKRYDLYLIPHGSCF